MGEPFSLRFGRLPCGPRVASFVRYGGFERFDALHELGRFGRFEVLAGDRGEGVHSAEAVV